MVAAALAESCWRRMAWNSRAKPPGLRLSAHGPTAFTTAPSRRSLRARRREAASSSAAAASSSAGKAVIGMGAWQAVRAQGRA